MFIHKKITKILSVFLLTFLSVVCHRQHPLLANDYLFNDQRHVEHTVLEINILLHNKDLKALPKQTVQLIRFLENGTYEIISEKTSDYRGQLRFTNEDHLNYQVEYGLIVNSILQPLTFSTDTPTSWYEVIQLEDNRIDSAQLNLNNLDHALFPSKDIQIQLIDTNFQPISHQLIRLTHEHVSLEQITDDEGMVSFKIDEYLDLNQAIFQIYLNNEKIPYQIVPSTHIRLISDQDWPLQLDQALNSKKDANRLLNKQSLKESKRATASETSQEKNLFNPTNKSSNDRDPNHNKNNQTSNPEKSLTTDDFHEQDKSNTDNHLADKTHISDDLDNKQSIKEPVPTDHTEQRTQLSNASSRQPNKKKGASFNRVLPQTGEEMFNVAIVSLILMTLGLFIYMKSSKKNNND